MQIDIKGFPVRIDTAYIHTEGETVRQQVGEYLSGERQRFDLGLSFPDSFTGRVMQALIDVPYGETRTYGELAEQLDSAAVAVGQACGNNPVPIVVPCHRVVAAEGLGGYQYPGLKKRLLQLERPISWKEPLQAP